MAQATHTKKLHRKELRQPDEFVSLSRAALDWAGKHTQAVQIGVAAVVVVLLAVVGVRWYFQSRDATASQKFYGASELFKRQQWDPAQQSFAALAASYGGTAYGTLAKLYAGRSALNANRPAEAVPFLTDFVAKPPSVALEQIGRVALAHALEATSNTGGAREQYELAIVLDGPLRPDATIALARIEEGDGHRDKAVELYQKYLADDPDGAAVGLARMRLAGLGVTPPPAAPGMTIPTGGMPPLDIE
jgi:hypothetical protein